MNALSTPMMDSLGLQSLTPAKRLELMQELHDSVESEEPSLLIDPEFAAELDRRCAEYDANPSIAISLEESERLIQECIARCRAN